VESDLRAVVVHAGLHHGRESAGDVSGAPPERALLALDRGLRLVRASEGPLDAGRRWPPLARPSILPSTTLSVTTQTRQAHATELAPARRRSASSLWFIAPFAGSIAWVDRYGWHLRSHRWCGDSHPDECGTQESG
jgi:hypothetical protein